MHHISYSSYKVDVWLRCATPVDVSGRVLTILDLSPGMFHQEVYLYGYPCQELLSLRLKLFREDGCINIFRKVCPSLNNPNDRTAKPKAICPANFSNFGAYEVILSFYVTYFRNLRVIKDIATLFLGKLKRPKWLTSTKCLYFRPLLRTAFLKLAEGKTKVL